MRLAKNIFCGVSFCCACVTNICRNKTITHTSTQHNYLRKEATIMQNDESQSEKDEVLRDLQNLWHESTNKETLKIQEKAMLKDIQKQMQLVDFLLPSGGWSVIALQLFLMVKVMVATYQSILHEDTNKIILGFMITLVLLAWAGRNILARVKIDAFDTNNQRDFLHRQLARVQTEIFYQTKILPYLLIIIFASFTASLWFKFEVSKIINCLTVLVLMVLQFTHKGSGQDKLIPMRDKLQSALQQLNEH